MRFHVIGLNHLPVSRKYMPCAFTQKIHKLCDMLMSLGHDVYLYGAEGSDAKCTKFFETLTLRDLRDSFGTHLSPHDIGYDWRADNFHTDFPNEKDTSKKHISECIQLINEHKKPDDFLLLSMGLSQKPIADAVGLYLTLETGIGYRGSYAPFRAFESSFIRAYQYGVENAANGDIVDGKFYDRVIPNYFEADDFGVPPIGTSRDYVAFIGRMIRRKGVNIVVEACKEANVPLKLAGQGGKLVDGVLKGVDFETVKYDNMEYLGTVDAEQRYKLMSNAYCLMVPTIYQEPFGGVNVEAQLCGTPVVTSAFGVFPETVIDNETGYLCHTMRDFVKAIEMCRDGGLDEEDAIFNHASQYLMENVKWLYQDWFEDLHQVYLSTVGKSKGWYQIDYNTDETEWEEAQVWEKNWWSSYTKDFTNTYEEERKQMEYALSMGLERNNTISQWFKIPGGPVSVLDIGSNAVSLLLKTQGHVDSVVLDPMSIPQWAKDRYKSVGIEFVQGKGEEMLDVLEGYSFDEVWIYNCLQHVDDPKRLVSLAMAYGKTIRVFEWVNMSPRLGHPHTFTKKDLDDMFQRKGNIGVYPMGETSGCHGEFYYGVFDYT